MARETFQIGDLTAVIGDNEAYRERCSRDEVLEEFRNWRATLKK